MTTARATDGQLVLQGDEPSVTELKEFSLEELIHIKVTSVARSPEPLINSPAAITVITGDDIRRSGVTSIPEALRLAPGLEVARSGSFWAITSRGFNDQFSNKLLVMIDGRTVYSPLFAGVFWGVQDTLLEDIDRIEVIRGPGATLWGANAVNGVINIYTKSARETQGLLISGGGGTEEIGFANVRYGLPLNEDTYLRIYGKYFYRDDSKYADGSDAPDRWHAERGGFRLDSQPSDLNLFTLQGDIYSGFQDGAVQVPTATPPFIDTRFGSEVRGGNVLGRWTHTFSEESELVLQAYYDKAKRDMPAFNENRDTGDLDFQHRFPLGSRQEVTWGGGYRITGDTVGPTAGVAVEPPSRTTHLYSAFVQDEIAIVPDQWQLTVGSKFEHNDFTGFEVQPSVRLLWIPAEHHLIWAAVSRAVRTPARVEDDIIINPPGVPPGAFSVRGQRSFESEELVAYEIGYRVQLHKRLTVDIAAFYNDYEDLNSVELQTPSLAVLANEMTAENYGVEIAPAFQATRNWRLSGGYTFLESDIERGPRSVPLFVQMQEGNSPQHQFFVRSAVDIGRSVEWDAIFRYVDHLSATGVPRYFSLDTRVAWQIRDVEIAIVGQNLLESHRLEFRSTGIGSSRAIEVERGVYGKITWRF